MLTETTNEEFFALESVKIIIFYLWQKFFWKIFKRLFIPFIIYLLSFVIYVTFVCEAYGNNQNNRKYLILDLVFAIFEILCISFFSFFEFRGLYTDKLYYFSSFWNYIDFCSIFINVGFIICDLTGVDIMKLRVIGAAAVLCMWIKFFYYLRIFQPTAKFIRLLTQIISDLSTFSFTFILAVLAFANAFYILSLSNYDT